MKIIIMQIAYLAANVLLSLHDVKGISFSVKNGQISRKDKENDFLKKIRESVLFNSKA